jgi:hypothetical protein
VEISARGARFAEDSTRSLAEAHELVEDLERRLKVSESLASRTRLNVDQLAEKTRISLRD